MKMLHDLIGVEAELTYVARALKDYARSQRAALVGAVQITCSDESERECVEAFQQWFAQEMLPELKFGSHSPLRCANLGGRYEWGAGPLAEQHFATAETADAFKLMVTKINSHVSVEQTPEGPRFGRMSRYGMDSVFCSAIHAVMDGAVLPFTEDLEESFASEGLDRLAILRDLPEQTRGLLAAVASARLQARRAILDIQDHPPGIPTVFLVLPCVTINRPLRDTEIVCGMYTADRRTPRATFHYRGLGDDPSKYDLSHHHRAIRIGDDHVHHQRDARDHRELVWQQWRRRTPPAPPADPRLAEIVNKSRDAKSGAGPASRELLKSMLWILADLAPAPAAVLLFAKGVAGIHNAQRAYRIAHDRADADDARQILQEIQAKVDTLPPQRAAEIIELLSERGA